VDIWYRISGTLKYDNLTTTTLNGMKLNLNKDGIPIDSTVTDVSGNYVFGGHADGTYTVSLVSTKPWGGSNSTDALLVQRYFSGLNPLSGLKLMAGDANNNTVVNSTDALLIKRRFAGLITSFSIADWIIDVDTVIISGAHVSRPILGLCAGDVNASYVPLAKSGPGAKLQQQGKQIVNQNQEFEIPIRTQDKLEAGAISLIIGYPIDMLEIIGISSKAENLAGMITNIMNGRIYVAWENLQPLMLNANEPLLTLRVKYTGNISQVGQFSLNLQGESEIADELANVLQNVNLLYPELLIPTGIISQNAEELQMQVSPNPFIQNPVITYELPTSGKVSIVIYDIQGRVVGTLVNAQQTEGKHSITLETDGLAEGVYQARLILVAADKIYMVRNNLILVK